LFVVGTGVIALSAVACSGAPGDASAAAGSAVTTTHAPTYLALGDSIAFGDDGYIPFGDPSRVNSAQFVGYPFDVAKLHYGSASAVTDLGCPGETTASFFDNAATDNGCREYKGYGGGNGAWLHTPYGGTQMETALAYLAAHEVDLVTITLGGNDLLLAQKGCATAASPTLCEAAAIPSVVSKGGANVGKIVAAIRGAGYFGKIVFLTQYATNYEDATQLAAIPLLNDAISAAVTVYGGRVASGFDTFASLSVTSLGDPCKAGLLIPNPDGTATCDKHPSTAGASDLAFAVNALSY
jgi:hypothetical protein